MASNPWQRLLQYIGAHMHEPVEDDRCDRALRALGGQLVQNAPYVWASLRLGLPPATLILDVAISPTGNVGILVANPPVRDRSDLRVLVWSWGGGMRERVLGRSVPFGFAANEETRARILWAEGSEEPVVVTRVGGVNWGGEFWNVRIPVRPFQQVFWVEDGRLCLATHESHGVSRWICPHTTAQFDGRTHRWICAAGGFLVRSVVKSGTRGEAVEWRGRRAELPGDDLRVDPHTICVRGDDMYFVAGGGHEPRRAYRWAGDVLAGCRVPNGMAIRRTHNRLFAIPTDSSLGQRTLEFTGASFGEIDATEDAMPVDMPVDLPSPSGGFPCPTEVSDSRGYAAMTWSYVSGTFHVIRYDLSSKRS